MFVSPRRLRLHAHNGNPILLQPLALSRLDPFIRSSVEAHQSRKLGSIAKIEALGKPAGQEEEEDDLLSSLTKRRGGRTKKGIQKISPKDWLLTEEGLKFRHPTVGRPNWLGDDIPFPTNPWFKPQPPLSDKIRTKVYESFKQRVHAIYKQKSYPDLSLDEKQRQEQILIRETSEQWGICRDRVSAIIRLKAMEDSWPLNKINEEGEPIKPHKRTLQLNFEKGMESVLGVQTDQVLRHNEDINELANRRLQRKSSFYGTEFVPIDSPEPDAQPTPPRKAQTARSKNSNKYQENDEPTETRHIIGSDGLPRPSTSYISKPPNKIPMVFTDVSEFPRAPKPMSKRKARYYPKTSLLPDYSVEPTRSSSNSARRSHSTAATASSSEHIDSPQFSSSSSGIYETAATSNKQREKMDEERRSFAARLLKQLKGCANSENGSKLIDQLSASPDYSEFSNLTGIDADEIKESLLLRAGGLSFKTSGGPKNAGDFTPDRINPTNNDNGSPVSEDEKQIRSIKFEMIKSIYLKKLELNSSGRLLLPKSIRSQEEKDLKILQNTLPSSSTQSPDRSSNPSQSASSDLISSRSNQLVRKCMKGPLGRIKQRQQLQLLANRKQTVNH
ncbi:hypothetical protein PtA15_15A442 [Puccinia triticina]|uniref:37S ribosomal protein S25, mitochondrial n=1 Tax=Puccinia triticina TaxID=208348 RepID=A0ABY7D5U1_9BASI|nr:uncharacterized protein PtA15_15A442 [Puccinia triticina]WAQ92047.1 hypothetical protein PtA15_15A442 [Puccinia triticina]WAR62861.1 hypothetical protein PtB15_15B449 [Puccinia triticina]